MTNTEKNRISNKYRILRELGLFPGFDEVELDLEDRNRLKVGNHFHHFI